MFPHLGIPELILILVILLIIFGPGKLPQFGRWLGRTIRQVRESSRDTVEGYKESIQAEDEKDDKQQRALEASKENKAQ
ncbi:Sec-independent protein translocase subunit TatA/TatB [Desulforudis sp. 1088]|uniref:Sec-independent protein translocase subunit TatA/TatB n=1 Tax=unclassified Candidatus Desulforudis TaxID=2635950 RepID=UPI00346A092E